MKTKALFIVTVLVMSAMGMTAQTRDAEQKLNMHYSGHHGDHSEFFAPADMPDVYYDSDNLEIIIVADGYADYYDVNIISQSTQLAVISTQIGGYGDTIDVYSLPDDDYTILITSSNNNQYVGQFTNY